MTDKKTLCLLGVLIACFIFSVCSLVSATSINAARLWTLSKNLLFCVVWNNKSSLNSIQRIKSITSDCSLIPPCFTKISYICVLKETPHDVQLKYENFWRLLTQDRTENNFATNVLKRKSAFRAKTEIKYVNMKRKKGYPR